jgi:antitoxin (DNA-binding transcriptional repressor) of toxin-antitoxin stability system
MHVAGRRLQCERGSRREVIQTRGLPPIQLQLKVQAMKTVTMVQFRQDAEGVLRRIAQGERFLLSHRGKPAARLEPLDGPTPTDPALDPFLGIARRAKASPKGRTKHGDIDRILYGRP